MGFFFFLSSFFVFSLKGKEIVEGKKIHPVQIVCVEILVFLFDGVVDTEFIVSFDETVEFIASMVFRVLADDIGLKDRVLDILIGLEDLHEPGIVIIEDILSYLFDSFDVIVCFDFDFLFLWRIDDDFRLDIDLGTIEIGTVLEEELLVIHECGILFDEFVSFFDKKYQFSDQSGDEAVLIGLDIVIGTYGKNLIGNDISVFVDILDVLGVAGKMHDRGRIRLLGQFDRSKVGRCLGDHPRIVDDRSQIEKAAFDVLDPGVVETG